MPAPPPRMGRDDPTGRARFRKTWLGRLVLEIELRNRPSDPALGDETHYWTDAQEDDLWRLRHYRKHNGMESLL